MDKQAPEDRESEFDRFKNAGNKTLQTEDFYKDRIRNGLIDF